MGRSLNCPELRRGAHSLARIYASTSARCFTSLPIIDVTPLLQPTSPQQQQLEVADQLHKAAKDVGFFYVKGDMGLPKNLQSDVLQLARSWFELPVEQKQQISISPERHFRGYQALGANVTRYDNGFQRDMHEGIDFYKELPEDTQPHSRLHGPNQWPEGIPELGPSLRLYVQHMLHLGDALMKGIGLGLGVPQRLPGEPATPDESYWCMRVISYPPLPSQAPAADVAQQQATRGCVDNRLAEIDRSVQLSCGEHTDYGLLTLVNQQMGVSALQVKNGEGRWIDAEPIEGTFVCNTGDCLQRMTNGVYKPTRHRVINNTGGVTRTSIAFFYEPAFEATIRPADALSSDGAAFDSLRYGSHLEQKVFSNFEL